MTTEERIAAIRADLNGASGVSRNGERIRSAHAHLDAIQVRLCSLTEAAQVAADALGKARQWQETLKLIMSRRSAEQEQYVDQSIKGTDTALSLLSREGITPGGG
jgi:hypothetical protein